MNLDKLKGHTPGPWRFNSHGWAPTQGTIVSNQSHPICELADAKHRQCYGGKTGNDGPLIAAAPELLVEVERLREAIIDYCVSMIRLADDQVHALCMECHQMARGARYIIHDDGCSVGMFDSTLRAPRAESSDGEGETT